MNTNTTPTTTTRADALADAILATRPLFVRFLDGFDEQDRTRQVPGMPNHVIWTLGHVAMTMHRIARLFDDQPFPASDFVTGDGSAGDGQRFDTESVRIGSEPVDDPQRYPSLARGIAIFEAACERFASTVRAVSDDAVFDRAVPWHDGEIALWSLVVRACFHNGTHAGQLVDLRRMLGMPLIIQPKE